MDVLTLIGLISTVVGLVLAGRSLGDGKDMLLKTSETQRVSAESAKNSQSLLSGLAEVAASLTTHRAGESPNDMQTVNALVKTAQKSVQVNAILPGIRYSSYSEGWTALANGLRERQEAGVKMILLIGSSEVRRSDHYVRFVSARADWATQAFAFPYRSPSEATLLVGGRSQSQIDIVHCLSSR